MRQLHLSMERDELPSILSATVLPIFSVFHISAAAYMSAFLSGRCFVLPSPCARLPACLRLIYSAPHNAGATSGPRHPPWPRCDKGICDGSDAVPKTCCLVLPCLSQPPPPPPPTPTPPPSQSSLLSSCIPRIPPPAHIEHRQLQRLKFPLRVFVKAGITGHSMGGHGALTIFLKVQASTTVNCMHLPSHILSAPRIGHHHSNFFTDKAVALSVLFHRTPPSSSRCLPSRPSAIP